MATPHPRCSLVQPPQNGYPFQVIFNHPIIGKRVKRSLKTTDGKKAVALCIELSKILTNPSVWKTIPQGTSEVIEKIWRGDLVDQALADALDHVSAPV